MPKLPVASWFPKCLAQAVGAIAPGCIPLLVGLTGTVAFPVAAGVACFGAAVWLNRWEGKKQSEEQNKHLQDYFQYLLQTQANSREEILEAIKQHADKLPDSLPLDQEATDRLVALTRAVHQLRDQPSVSPDDIATAMQPLLAGHDQTQSHIADALLEARDRFDGVDAALADIREDLAAAAQSIKDHTTAEHDKSRKAADQHADAAAAERRAGFDAAAQRDAQAAEERAATDRKIDGIPEAVKEAFGDELAELKAMIQARSARDPGEAAAPAQGGPQSDELLEDALVRLARDAERGDAAARKALEDKSPDEAADYFIQKRAALAQARSAIKERLDGDEIQINREAAEVFYRTGRINDAEQALQRILELLPNDLSATNRLGHIYHLRGDLDAAERQYRALLDIAPDDACRAAALGNLGLIAQTRGDLDAAEKLHHEALDINRKLGRLEGQASTLGNLGVIARTRGDLDAAETLHRESLDIERQLGRLEGQASTLGNLGVIALTRGDLDAAEKLHREALDLNRKLGRLEGQANQLGNLGNIAQTRGNLDAAEKLHREALDLNRKLSRLEGQASTLGNLGLIALTRGDLDAAEELHRESLAIERQLGRLEGQANQLGNLGNIAWTRGDLDAAEELYRESLKLNRQLGRLEGQANQLANLGVIAQTRGDLDEARALWTQSRDLFAQIGMPHRVELLQGWLDSIAPA